MNLWIQAGSISAVWGSGVCQLINPNDDTLMTEQEIRNKIACLVAELQKKRSKDKSFVAGQTPINYAGRIFDEKEVQAAVESSLDFWLTEGRFARKFQAEIAAWGTGTDPDSTWNQWRTEEYDNGRNYGGYSNTRIDELYYQSRREFDFEKRRKIFQEIHKVLYDDQPYIWIYNRPILAVFNKRIRGVQLSPRGIYNFYPSFEGWWVGRESSAAMP